MHCLIQSQLPTYELSVYLVVFDHLPHMPKSPAHYILSMACQHKMEEDKKIRSYQVTSAAAPQPELLFICLAQF